MKYLFSFLIAIVGFAFMQTQAQSVVAKEVYNASKHREIKFDTTVNTDTVIISYNSIGSKVKSFYISLKKLSGTVAGKIYLEATHNGFDWDRIDSLTVSNSDPSVNKKLIAITSTNYNSYRSYYTTTSTQSCIVFFSYLRRPDE